MTTTQIGAWAESLALSHIKKSGWELVAHNFFCKGGEIDIVARRHNILAFIEVKYRSNKRMGGAIASLTQLKQRRIIHSAQVFLQTYPGLRKLDCRFDLIAVEGRNGSDSQVQIQWLENAFITLG
jgi:putative endonuclease